jgi:hypothetical protein
MRWLKALGCVLPHPCSATPEVGKGQRRYATTLLRMFSPESNPREISGLSASRAFLRPLFTVSLLLALSLSISIVAYARDVTLAWEASSSSDIAGYRLYYGTRSLQYSSSVDAGGRTYCTLTNLQEGMTYYVAATAYNADDVESGFSNEIVFSIEANAVVPLPSGGDGSTPPDSGGAGSAGNIPASAQSDGGGGGGGGGCFIATAAFGSYLNPHVRALRTFRDSYLVTNGPGRVFVRLYYAVSPSAAAFIRKSETLRSAVRLTLIPAVAFGYLCLAIGFIPGVLLIVLSVAVLLWIGRRHFPGKGPLTVA